MKNLMQTILVAMLATCVLRTASANEPAGEAVSLPELLNTTQLDGNGAKPLVVTPEQEAAVKAGLAWLARNQQSNGSWKCKIGYKVNESYSYEREMGHVGVTSLACIAFLAGGHLPGRGEYGEVVEKGLEFVLASVKDDGYISRFGSRMYSHAFATLFLAEIYGMTHRDDVRLNLQKAVDFIVKSQNAQGGWRYEPYAPESDMSIVVCQVLALRAARNIGIRVPKSTVDRAARYVVDSAVSGRNFPRSGFSSRAAEAGTFHYQKESNSRSSFALTSAGVTALHGLGIYSDESIQNGLEYLRKKLRGFNSKYGIRQNGHYFFWYGHYYGVQAMYTAGSPYWEPYFVTVRDLLIDMQLEDGAFPNEVGPGKALSTAMGVLILEIPFRYLPIFQR